MSGIWIDKYRPKNFKEIIGQESFIKRIKAFLNSKNLPHLLFSGSPGCGKTTTALVIATELYGKNGLSGNFLELNASDDRGIDVIRNQIKEFAKLKSLAQIPYKVICLDEADSLTKDAQQALRRTMEKYSHTCRFILSCNEISKLIDPIQSRCVIFKFKPLDNIALKKIIENILKDENLKIENGVEDLLIEVSKGDVRKLLNTIQAVSVTDKNITKKSLLEITEFINPSEIKNMIKYSLDGDFFSSRKELIKLRTLRGFSGLDILKEIYKNILKLDKIEDNLKIKIVDKIATAEFRIIEGCDPEIQIESILVMISLINKNKNK